MTPEHTRQDPAKQFPGRTTPTWEIELLLSGATVFALVQLAGALPDWGGYLLPRLTDFWQQIVRLVLIYLQCGVILLCVAFVLHLLLRAYWVALVGMDSVYPGGLQSDRMRGGPVGRDWVARRWTAMPDQIEQADNLSSVVFGLGIGLARMMVNITVMGSLLLVLTLGLSALTGQADKAGAWVIGGFSLALLPYLLATMIDRQFGHRLAPGGLAYRMIQSVHAALSKLGLGRESSPLVTIYTTNVGEDRGNWIVGGVITLACIASFLSLDMLDDDLGIGTYGAFPALSADAASAVGHSHYASLHEPDESPGSPFLPDLQASGNYLPLVVPFIPTRHGHLLESCDGGQAKRDDDRAARALRRQRLLGCLAGGLKITLDGEPLAVSPELYSDAGRDLRGLMYMIPLAGQSRGRHELVVVLAPEEEPRDGESPPTWRIPYWY
ncbi:hypothetical protein [Arenimonas sp.]|uniref:hypothetical protein n=1 Tax=Arenimonas sp. TaxID=1872635 RepID=UPI0035B06B92